MKVDLQELLRAHPICHPTTIIAAKFADGNLALSLTGYPWWRETGSGENASYEFYFEFIDEGCFDPVITTMPQWSDFPNDEALEFFSVESLAGVDWAGNQTCDIYCSGPLKFPISLYIKLEEHLAKAKALKQPKDFLNGLNDTVLASFNKIVSENSFLLARATDGVCEILTKELERQDVPHNVIRRTGPQAESRLRVRLDNSDFLCRAAYAFLPD